MREQVLDLVALAVEGFVAGIRPLAAPRCRIAGIDTPGGLCLAEPGTAAASAGDQASVRRQGMKDEADRPVDARLALRRRGWRRCGRRPRAGLLNGDCKLQLKSDWQVLSLVSAPRHANMCAGVE